jgi:hypothetical protein
MNSHSTESGTTLKWMFVVRLVMKARILITSTLTLSGKPSHLLHETAWVGEEVYVSDECFCLADQYINLFLTQQKLWYFVCNQLYLLCSLCQDAILCQHHTCPTGESGRFTARIQTQKVPCGPQRWHIYLVYQNRVTIREHQSRLQKESKTEEICSLVIRCSLQTVVRFPAGHQLMWTGFCRLSTECQNSFLCKGTNSSSHICLY